MSGVALDSSVLIPGINELFESHSVCKPQLERATVNLQSVWVETLASLTRMPGRYALSIEAALRGLKADCPSPMICFDADQFVDACRQLAEAGISGGRLYDGFIAMCAKENDLLLLTRDRRAIPTYTAVGVQFEMVTG